MDDIITEMDDVITEILLRLPPGDPRCLVRASLVCKPWRRLLSDPAFLRLYRAFHRTPPVLGFFQNDRDDVVCPRLIPTTAFPLHAPPVRFHHLRALDCRHGRSLFRDYREDGSLVVWDPVARRRFDLSDPNSELTYVFGAVLCSAAGCDHADAGCRGGPFRVVLAGAVFRSEVMSAWVYSSETGGWSAPATLMAHAEVWPSEPSVLIGDALYFHHDDVVLRYDLVGHCLSSFRLPKRSWGVFLMDTEDPALGFAKLIGCNLILRACEVGSDGVAASASARRRIVNLKKLFPILRDRSFNVELLGFAEGTDIVFVEIFDVRAPGEFRQAWGQQPEEESGEELCEESEESEEFCVDTAAGTGIFTIELMSERVKKVWEGGQFRTIFPYMSFCTPDLAAGR